jgi:hypothetical protein
MPPLDRGLSLRLPVAPSPKMMATMRPSLKTRRSALLIYALALTIATHWPNLEIRIGEIPRPDILLHAVCFGMLTLLILISGLFRRPVLTAGNIGLTWLAGAAWSGLDELSQGLPGINRWVAWSDFFANLLGVTLIALAALVYLLLRRSTATGVEVPRR